MAQPERRWMPMDWALYWRDTGHLSALEHGAYLNLIGAYWSAGEPLQDNAAWLQRLSKCTVTEWRKIADTILAFFQRKDGKLHHKKIDKELADAKQRYERRASAGQAGGVAKSKQKPSNATAMPEQSHPHTTLVQSPNGDTPLANARGRRAAKSKGTRLENDWKFDAKTLAVGLGLGLTDAEITAELSPGGAFFDHFQSAECDNPIRPGWDLSARKWLRRGAREIIGRRPRDGAKPSGSISNRASVTAARNKILAQAGVQPLGSADAVRTQGSAWADFDNAGDHTAGVVLEADEWERVPGSADGYEIVDPTDAGDNGRSCRADDGLPQTTDGIPSGRSSACAEDPARAIGMVASLGRTERPAGDSHLPQTNDADGLEIPPFLKRTA